VGEESLVNAIILCISPAKVHILRVYARICCQAPYSEIGMGKDFCSAPPYIGAHYYFPTPPGESTFQILVNTSLGVSSPECYVLAKATKASLVTLNLYSH